MRSCIRVIFMLALLCVTALAQDGPVLDAAPPRPPQIDPSELDPVLRQAAKVLDDYREALFKPKSEEWAVVCEACGLHPSIRSYAAEAKPFPAAAFVSLLTHPKFAVRMGALEILEEKSAQDSGFDPWQPASSESTLALKQWQAWTAKLEGKSPSAETETAAPVDVARMRALLVDLVGDDVGRQERAFETLARADMQAVAFLEQYLHDTAQLAEGTRSRIRQAQFRLVLLEALPKDDARLARDLVYGTRDQKLAAMQMLPRCRLKAVPVLAEFLPDADALIREAAMDALILAGEEAVYDLVQERLKVETDENVIHAVLRRVSPGTQRGSELIASFITSANEDLVVAALNALSDGKSSAGKNQVAAALKDSRWRVRVAALEYAGKLKVSGARDAVLAAFHDQDEFVRYAAMKAAADMKLSGAEEKITEMALKDDTLLGPATDAIVRMGVTLPEELVAVLPSKSGESLLGVLRAFGKQAGHDGEHIEWDKLNDTDSYSKNDRANAQQALKIVRTLAAHRDPDVSAMAIQILASLLLDANDKKLVLEAMQKADVEGRISLIMSMQPGPFDFRESMQDEADESATTATKEDDIFNQVLREPAPTNAAQLAIYAAFGVKIEPPTNASAVTTAAPGERLWAPMEKEFHDFLVQCMEQRENGELAFLAASQLALGGQRRAITQLRTLLPRLEAHERAQLAALLPMAPRLTAQKQGLLLLRSLLQDESPEVRADAVEATLDQDKPEHLRMLLDEVSKPEGQLRAVNIYGYSLVNATERAVTRNVIENWATEVLADTKAREDVKTLALVLLGTTGRDSVLPLIEPALASSNVWQRRAAWRALSHLEFTQFEEKAERIASDSSPRVREALAVAYLKSARDGLWRVWFGERDWDDENVPYRQRPKSIHLPEPLLPLIQKLTRDEDDHVRIQAMMTLIGHGHDLDALTLRESLSGITDAKERRQFLEPFLESSWRTMPSKWAFLLDLSEKSWFSDDEWPLMRARLAPTVKKEGVSLTRFASLVKGGGTAEVTDKAADAPIAAVSKSAEKARQLTVLFFYKPGCKDCERVRDMLRDIGESQPLKLEEHNIERSSGAELNQALSQRFKVSAELQQVTPAVFTQAGALVKTELTFGSLSRLIEKSAELAPDESWHQLQSQELAAAGKEIVERFSSFSIGWVAMAGLLDGINPCAFATIIFLLSYLQVARRSPREILMVGAAFVLAVFIAYFAVGLGLSQVVAELQAFSGLRLWLNRLLALVALILAWLSFRDGLRALRGDLASSTLQLPEFLKTRIRSVIRVQARSSHFVVAAFVSGIVISLLELACTGQVYLPTIVYMMKQGSLSAVGYLLVYNLAFILPLVVIFISAWAGLRSERLITLQKRHTATLRFATALLFLALWVVLLVA